MGRKSRELRNPKTARWKWALAPLVILLAGIAYYGTGSSGIRPGSTDAASLKKPAPDFTLANLDGRPVSLSGFRGKVVILDFWAPWCPPCKKEIPDLISLQDQYGPRGLQIVGIGLDRADNVDAFVRESGINYPVMVGDADIADLYGGIPGIPTTFIIDREGNIVRRFEGYTTRAAFETAIGGLL